MKRALALALASLFAFVPAAGAQIVTVTPTALDAFTVATGGTAVVALTAGHRPGGGWIMNPSTTTALCINEIGTATTTPSGNTTCIAPGQAYNLLPAAGAVSVNATDSAHVFSGYGIQ